MDVIGPGTLKLVALTLPSASLADAVEEVLCVRVGANDVRRLGDAALLVYGDAATADVRDWVAAATGDDVSAIVVEFEIWSARGDAVDRRWLLRRGH